MEPSAARSVRLAGERKAAKRKCDEAAEEAKQAAGDGAQTTQTGIMHSPHNAMAIG